MSRRQNWRNGPAMSRPHSGKTGPVVPPGAPPPPPARPPRGKTRPRGPGGAPRRAESVGDPIGEEGGRDAPTGDGGDRLCLGQRPDLVQASQRPEVEEGRTVAAAREAER